MKRLFLAILTLAIAVPVMTKAAISSAPAIGLPGTISSTQVELRDFKVTYRFDQMNEPGKSAGLIPVQMVVRLQNTGATQLLTLAIPLKDANNQKAKVLSVFVNGLEVPVKETKTVLLHGSNYKENAAVFDVNLSRDAIAIVDVRMHQPIDKQILPFMLSTANGWNETISAGTIEAIVPFMPANWNLELRNMNDDSIMSLTYSENRASYTLQNLNPTEANDVYWNFANMDALEYFARGNERFQKTQGDAKSYEMMRTGLLDMIPCNGVRMPLSSWWRNMYETVTAGVIASAPEGQERIAKAMELWSDNWTVPDDSNRECLDLKQRPDRYKQVLSQMLAIPPAERSTVANDAIKKHEAYMRALSQSAGDGSVADSQEKDLTQDENISDTDRALMANWDSRFIDTSAKDDANNGSLNGEKAGWTSSTIAKLQTWFPDMSLGSQIMLFIFLAAMLIIIVSFIIIKWKEQSEQPNGSYMGTTSVKNSASPSFITTSETSKAKHDVEAPVKPIATMQETPKYPPVPNEPRSAESFIAKDIKDDKRVNYVNEKTEAPHRTHLLDEAYQDKPKDMPVTSDPLWIKKESPQQLIKPTAPPPAPSPNNLPWQKKNDDNEQPPGPMVNI
jgi:hypothetical protein